MPAAHSTSDSILSQLANLGQAARCYRPNDLPAALLSRDCVDAGQGDNPFEFVWLPQPLPPGRSACIASSRLSKRLEAYPSWFDAIRTIFVSLQQSRATEPFLLTAPNTTTDRFVRRLSKLFEIPVVSFEPFPKRVTAKWIAQQLQEAKVERANQTAWYFSNTKNAADAALLSVATEARILKLSSGGNVDRALQSRLSNAAGQTWLLIDDGLSKPTHVQPLLDAGATAWWLYRDHKTSGGKTSPGDVANEPTPTAAANILALDDVDSSEYLLHWTRRRTGPWPDQADAAYLDDLIFCQSGRRHDQLAALGRILATERILGSRDLTRSETPVVCFSDVRLPDLPNLRTFRSHLHRWDFEPYGIAIARSVLAEFGGRAVIYGDDESWQALPNADRPFFQTSHSSDGKIDWREEREWRVCGDVRLRDVPSDAALVFVASHEEAAHIAPLSRWPVVVLGSK